MTDFRYGSDDIIDDFGNQIAVDRLSHKQGEDDEFIHGFTSVA